MYRLVLAAITKYHSVMAYPNRKHYSSGARSLTPRFQQGCFLFKKKKFFFLIWLHWVLAEAHRIFDICCCT